MQKSTSLFTLVLVIILATACSRKTIPQKQETAEENIKNNNTNGTEGIMKNADTDSVVVAAAPRKTVVITTPKFISVNDAVAKKSVDGRLYYDLEGKRYWKNYKNGKYYLYNKNMNGNPDYKPRS